MNLKLKQPNINNQTQINMIIKLKFAVIALLMICSQNVFSQSKTVQGVVTDNAGLPLSGVKVLEQGTKNATSTGFDGKFALNNVASGSKIIFTFIGMNSKTVDFTGQASVNVMLAPATEELKQVVVVAYGSQKRANVTGAISTINAKDIAAIPVTNAAQALQGRAAGVTITNGGGPGDLPVVTIRGLSTFGNSQPLYVVDGTIVGNLSGINPGDIDNISVLKDASTASLYGAIGSNGVVVVTTKKGSKGKGQLNFNMYTGVNFVSKRYDVMNSTQLLGYLKDAYAEKGLPNPNQRDPSIASTSINYQDEIFQTGIIKDYNLSYSSGSESGTQRFSGEYQKMEGSLIDTQFERYSFRANSTHNFGKLTVGSSLGLNFTKQKPEAYALSRTSIENAIKFAPYLPVYDSANLGGFSGVIKEDGQDAENPVGTQKLYQIDNKSLGVIGNIFGEYEFIPGLKFRTQINLDYYNAFNKKFIPSFYEGPIINTGGKSNSEIAYYYGQNVVLDNSLNYKKTFAEKHNVEILALTSNTRTLSGGRLYANSDGLSRVLSNVKVNVAPAVPDPTAPILNTVLNSAIPEETVRVGLLARLNYNYDEKYLLAGSVRRDASSRFGPSYRWGTFYSAALGWNIAKENFMKDTPINNLKLRASYGIVGLDNVAAYSYELQYETLATGGYQIRRFINPDIKWEEKAIKNLGLDFGLYNNQFTGSIEVFNNLSKDLLVSVPVDPSLGSGTVSGNYASVETKGVEVVLGYNDNKGDFTWSANFNIGTANNVVVSSPLLGITSGDFRQKGTGFVFNTAVGHPINSFYGKVMDGIYQNQAEVDAVLFAKDDKGVLLNTTVKPGDVRFKDFNKDGKINDEDKDFIGNPAPDFTYGLNLSAAYKGFDLNLFFNGVQGNKIFNGQLFDLQGQTQAFNAGTAVLDRWTTTNPSNTIPRAFSTTPQNNEPSTRYIEDGSFTRLKNITLGYTLPNKAFEKYLTKLRMYVSGQNLLTFTKYSGLDPEIGGKDVTNSLNQGNAPTVGFDQGVYPQPKTIIMGVELTF
jgi:TonB-dependent starch-binding outer membrane protein SusC